MTTLIKPVGRPRQQIVSYEQAHLRLKVDRGRPDAMSCVQCGGTAAEWAYQGGDPGEIRSAEGRPYSLDQDRYAPMCIVCHRRHDRAAADGRSVDVCPRGHEWNERNTGIRKKRSRGTGLRFCRPCNRENTAAWRERNLQSAGAQEHLNAAARQRRAAKHAGTLTVGEAARLTGLRYRLVADSCRSGALRATQHSAATRGHWRINRADLDAWLRGERAEAS